MAVRIRVYPQYGGLGMNRFGMNGLGMNGGGAVSAATYYNSRLTTQKQVSSLQLGYERALANERIERARLEERAKNPYMSGGIGGAYGGIPLGAQFGGLPLGGQFGGQFGGLPMGAQFGGQFGGLPLGGQFGGQLPLGGIPSGFGGSGQSNFTNQTSPGGANQTVTNSNVSNVSHQVQQPPFASGWGYPPQFGGGGLLSGLLGRLI